MADKLTAALKAIGERERAATPGPWAIAEKHGRDIADEGWSQVSITRLGGEPVAATWWTSILETANGDADAEFIAAARTAVPRLLAAVEAVLGLAEEAEPWAWVPSARGIRLPCRWDLDPRKVREAITAALTGEEARSG